MSLLANLTTSTDIEDEKDVVGGGYSPLESGLYPATIRLAYLEKSSGGALSLVLNLETDAKREIRQTLWMTSGNAKGNLNYFVNKDGEKQYLPGFTHANALTLLTIGKEISQLELDPVNHINNDIEAIKRKKLKLKDEIYRLLKSSEADPLT